MANSYTSKLKKRLPTPGDIGWDDEWHDNEKIDEVVMGALLTANRVISGGAVTAGTGLNANYAAMEILVAGAPYSIIAGSLALTAAAVGAEQANWIYVSNSGAMTVSTTPPAGDYVPLARVDTSDTVVIRIADLRPMVQSIHGFSNKTTPIDADEFSVWDSVTGLLRKVSWINIKATLKSYFDILYAALDSPSLTGTPTTPTPGNTVNNTQIANTAFVRNLMSGALTVNGYQRLGNGFVIQWGLKTCSATPGAPVAFTWPIAFTSVYAAVASGLTSNTSSNSVWVDTLTVNGGNIHGTLASQAAYFIAIGYITPS